MLLFFEILSNTSNEVAAAYATGAIGAGFGIFQFIGRERDRRKNQKNAIELEEFKQRSELFMSLKKNQIGYNDELLNEVYKIRTMLEDTLKEQDLEKYKFLAAALRDFVSYYRDNANKINYLDGEVRSYGHDILKQESMFAGTLKMIERQGIQDNAMQSLEHYCLKLQKLTSEYEDFLRSSAKSEFNKLKGK